MLDVLTSADFEPYLNESFTVKLDRSAVLDLIEITPHGPEPDTEAPKERRRPFSLVFRDRDKTHLPQKIYRLEHDGLGSLEIFLVPIGPDSQGMRYEAVFA